MGIDAEKALNECKTYRSDCQLDWFLDLQPPHKVDLDGFWIDQTEVTFKMYAACIIDGACKKLDSDQLFEKLFHWRIPCNSVRLECCKNLL